EIGDADNPPSTKPPSLVCWAAYNVSLLVPPKTRSHCFVTSWVTGTTFVKIAVKLLLCPTVITRGLLVFPSDQRTNCHQFVRGMAVSVTCCPTKKRLVF